MQGVVSLIQSVFAPKVSCIITYQIFTGTKVFHKNFVNENYLKKILLSISLFFFNLR